MPPRGYVAIVEMLIAAGATLPERTGDCSDAVRAALAGHGVADNGD